MTRIRLTGRPLIAASALALFVAADPAWAQPWSTIGYIPSNHVTVSYDRTTVTTDHGLTRAWFLFSYAAPVTTAESFVMESYKEYEVIDCKRRSSFTGAFTAFSEADGGGRTIYTWTGPNAVLPVLDPATPGSVRALMVDAACAPPLPKLAPLPPIPPAPASGASSAVVPGASAAPAPAMTMPAPATVKALP